MKVVLLCGGLGTRLREETEFKPKPMVEVGGKPLLWHIMKIFATHGFRDFVLCLGYKGDVIKDFFYNYELRTSDVTLTLGASKSIAFHNTSGEHDWKVTLVDTGKDAQTGARVKRIAKYLDNEPFFLTYGDGVSDIDISTLLKFHKEQGKIGTVTGIFPSSRFGHLSTQGHLVSSFNEKPRVAGELINGGFFVFRPEFLEYLSLEDECVLEGAPLARLSKNRELAVYEHKGFWHCMDTYRDFQKLNELWDGRQAPWKVWEDAEK